MTVLDPDARARVPPRRKPRWLLGLAYLAERTCVLLGGRAFYRWRCLSPRRLRVRHEVVEVEGLPPGLEGLCIAQLSDLHAGSFLGAGDLRHAVRAANAEEPDLVVLTGDYISHRWDDALALVDDLASLEPRLGTFAVFGNHDYRGRLEGRIAEHFAAAGVRFLRNEAVRLDSGDGVLALVGLEDLEEAKRIDADTPRAGLAPSDVEVLLCHNPKGAETLARRECALVLSGHTHGTQVDLPLLRSVGPPHPGDRRSIDGTVSITSHGLGVVGLPLRIGSRAEGVVVRLRRLPGSSADYNGRTVDVPDPGRNSDGR